MAALICVLTAFTTVSMARRVAASSAQGKYKWLLAAGFVAGAGTWATHFVAMLAYDIGVPPSFDVTLTLLSILIAVCGAFCSFVIAYARQPWRQVVGGAGLGASISAMHYTGMKAVWYPVELSWDVTLVCASLVLAVVLSIMATLSVTRTRGWRGVVAGTLLLTLAIVSLHFVAMSAMEAGPLKVDTGVFSPQSTAWLADLIVVVTITIVVLALAGVRLDLYLARRVIHERERLRALADATFEGILIHEGGIVTDVNKSLLDLLRCQHEDVLGRPITSLAASGSSFEGLGDAMAKELDLLRSDGTIVAVEVLARTIDYRTRRAIVLAIRDITERRASEQRIHQLAFRDSVTDLPNRRAFVERLDAAIGSVSEGRRLAVVGIDLDNFAAVNDSFGFAAGDALLHAVADRIRTVLRTTDTLARLGGDEFSIIQENTTQPESIVALCRRVVDLFQAPFFVEGHAIVIGASLGITFNKPGDQKSGDVLKRAIMATARAKEGRDGQWRFYDPEMDATMQARHALERDLRRAIELDQLQLYYQPLVNVASGQISGFEALLRWIHPERGFVSPAIFIPVAEELGLIHAIGKWVLREACAEATNWPDHVSVAVNLSPAQFADATLATEVSRILEETGLHASRLQVEVTESLLLRDDSSVLAILHGLHDLGIRIAMDDFGTGYSSLSYLRRFPFDKLKIDQSFVRGLDDGKENAAIIRAVVVLGRSLGMTVNAEGVETEDQFSALQAQECDEVQGYLFSRPVPASDVARLLRSERTPHPTALVA